MELQSRAVRECDQSECEQFIPSDAFMMFTPKVNYPVSDDRSAERADAETRENRPEDINRPPLPTPGAKIMKAAQPET